MSAFKQKPEKRLSLWSEFRDSLPTLPELEQLAAVVEFWKQCPYDRWVIDPLEPKSWPTAWEMIYSGQYCTNCVALGMAATLRYSGWDASRIELVMIKEHDTLSAEYFVVKIDNRFLLNYSYDKYVTVDDLPAEVETLYSYKWSDDHFVRVARD